MQTNLHHLFASLRHTTLGKVRDALTEAFNEYAAECKADPDESFGPRSTHVVSMANIQLAIEAIDGEYVVR